MIQITCGKCGRVAEAPESMRGQTLYCSGCQSPMKISSPTGPGDGGPAGATAEPEKKALRMAGPNQSASGGSLCPKCGIVKPDPQGVCGECGFDPRTGDSAADVYQRRQARSRAIRLLLLLAALALALAGAWRVYRSGAGEAGVLSNLRRWKGASGAPDSAVSPAKARSIRAAIVEKYDREYPMIGPYEALEVEMTSGRVLRGHSRKSDAPGVLLFVDEENVERSVPYDQLRPPSRIRFDAEFRKKFIDQQVQRAITPPPSPPAS